MGGFVFFYSLTGLFIFHLFPFPFSSYLHGKVFIKVFFLHSQLTFFSCIEIPIVKKIKGLFLEVVLNPFCSLGGAACGGTGWWLAMVFNGLILLLVGGLAPIIEVFCFPWCDLCKKTFNRLTTRF